MREHLVFVRAGKGSLHPRWLAEDPNRNWDCCVNEWGEPAVEYPGFAAEWHEPGGLSKFAGFQEIFPRRLADMRHRHVLLLDDDLAFSPGSISRFFEHCRRHRLTLSQPAIASGSHVNHVVTIRNPLCEVRRTNFVEVMAPCFDRATLDLLLPTFSLTRCTWGIDCAWSAMLRSTGALAIVDAVAMRHTKPMDVSGGPFYQRLMSLGIDPAKELAAMHERFPPDGAMRTLADGHVYRWPLPDALNRSLVAQCERGKLWLHRRRGGTLAPQTPVRSRATDRSAAPDGGPRSVSVSPSVAPRARVKS